MNGYLIVVEGDYFGTASGYDRKREKFPYRVTVKVPHPEGALSLIKNKLLDKVLRRNYDNYHIWRTHQLVSITNLDGSKVHGLTDPRLMDFNDLADYVRKNKLPLKLNLYTDLGYFRTMVYLAETNRHEFLIKQENLEREYKENVALAKLNPELYDGSQGLKDTNPSQYVEEGAKLTATKAKKQTKDYVDRTIITEGKVGVPKATNQDNMFSDYEADSHASVLATESKPKTQKVDKVYVAGKGYVPVNKFKEDFTKKDEKEFEVYDPYGLGDEEPDKETEIETAPRVEEVSVEDL